MASYPSFTDGQLKNYPANILQPVRELREALIDRHELVVPNYASLPASGDYNGQFAFVVDEEKVYYYRGVAKGWWIVNQPEDTGWVTLPYASGYKAATGTAIPRIEYRVLGGVFYVRGGGTNTAEAMASGYHTMVASGGIPEAYRPPFHQAGGGYAQGSRTGAMVVSPDGSVSLSINTAVSGNANAVYGSVSYPL